jgi:diacylglycerol O-acyltransferase
MSLQIGTATVHRAGRAMSPPIGTATVHRPGRARSVRIGQRLPAADTEMIAAERHGPHVSGACPWLWVMEGPCPSVQELVAHLGPRLPLRMRERVRVPPWRLTRPLWVQVPGWTLDEHVELVHDPRYWSREGWLEFISGRLAVRLDLARPPWRMWLIPHRDGSCFALVTMLHHALADGHSGVQLLMLSAAPAEAGPAADVGAPCEVGQVADMPGAAGEVGQVPAVPRAAREVGLLAEVAALAARDASDAARIPLAAARALVEALRAPGMTLRRARAAASALIALAADMRTHAAELPALNPPLSGRQCVGCFDLPASRVRPILERFDCFPNDLFLSLVGAAVGRLCEQRGLATRDLRVHVWMPVNTGGRHARATLGNHVAGVRVPVPVGPMGAEERLRRVRAASRRVATGPLVAAAELVTRLENALPAPALPWAASVALSPRTMHMIASHMVLPPAPEPLPGRRLREVRAWTFLPERHAATFAAQSLQSRLSVNYIVDPVSLPDHDLLERGMSEHAQALADAAAAGGQEKKAGEER